MARYTAEKILTFGALRESRAVIVSGTVAIAIYDENSYIVDDRSPLTSGIYEIFTQGIRVKFVPEAGSSIWIDEGTGK